MPVSSSLEAQASSEGGSVRFLQSFLNAMQVLGLEGDDRCQQLAQCNAFFRGEQHDHLGSDWNGIPRDPGVGYLHERLRPQGFVPVNSIPHASRKPDAPVPLGRQVTSRFSEMLTGAGRRPALRCWSSVDTQDFLDAAFKDADLWDVLSEARDVAGACGVSAIVLGLTGGRFDAEVLTPQHLWVSEWCTDQPGWVPNIVVHQTKIEKQVYVEPTGMERRGRLVTKQHWHTRAWTPTHVIYYDDVPVDDVPEDGFAPSSYAEHGFGACPVVWYQNTRKTDSPDGDPDCAGAYVLLDRLDRLQSQVYKAAHANADPTLVVKQTRAAKRRNSLIAKGSSHVIGLEPDGDAKYLEIQGTSVEVGLKAIERMVMQVLQTVECVVIHPDTAKAYQSGEALQILWRSMESKANRLRVTLGSAVQRICKLLLAAAKTHGVANSELVGTPSDAHGILLPPRRVPKKHEPVKPGVGPEADEAAEVEEPDGDEFEFKVHEPGSPNAYVDLEWPPYWTPTPAQIAQMAQAMNVATTQKQVISAETAARQFAQILGTDGDEELRRIAVEKARGTKALLHGLGGLSGFGLEDDDDDDGGQPEPAGLAEDEDEDEDDDTDVDPVADE